MADCSYDCSPDGLLGIALFNQEGLPRQYFITPTERDTGWVSVALQMLGMSSLLSVGLSVPMMNYGVVTMKRADVVVLRLPDRFLASLVRRRRPQTPVTVTPEWLAWLCEFEATQLRSHPHFRQI